MALLLFTAADMQFL